MLKCPECGSDLLICVSTIGYWSRKIKKSGEPYKTMHKSVGRPNGQGEYLRCEKYCGFTYEFWHEDNRIKEFDDWYDSDYEAFEFILKI